MVCESAERVRIIIGDCREQLRLLPDESVELVVTSPPYDNLRTYGGHTWDFEGTARELYRVLCEGGVVCWNVGDSVVDGSETLTSAKQKIFFREQCGFRIHDTMIYAKSGAVNPDATRYTQAFEYVFILSKGKPRAINLITDKSNKWAGVSPFGNKTKREINGQMSERGTYVTADFGIRENIWRGKTAAQEGQPCNNASEHPAMMPKWLAHDLILSWSNAGDTVLDPFAGSGTSAVAAIELGRKAIAIEINPQYAELIRERTNTTPGFAF